MFRGVREYCRLMRPRSLTRMQKSLEDVAEGMTVLRRNAKEQQVLAATLDEVRAQLRELNEKVSTLVLREAQLRAVAAADASLDSALRRLPAICDSARVIAHVKEAVARTPLMATPLPYMVVDDVFPADYYDALVRGIPPDALFADRPHNKQQLNVPFTYAPAFSRHVWSFLVDVVEAAFLPAVVDKFREPLSAWIASEWPQLAADPLGPPMKLHSTDGRILLRGRGYRITPHRDPKWGFITVLLYLARANESEQWGTQLYSVEDDDAAASISPYWIAPERCRLAVDVPFRRNTALVFLNSHGAHGASIPENAQPPDLKRYIYQFRIGPTGASIRTLVSMLPDDRKAMWEGKLVDYLA